MLKTTVIDRHKINQDFLNGAVNYFDCDYLDITGGTEPSPKVVGSNITNLIMSDKQCSLLYIIDCTIDVLTIQTNLTLLDIRNSNINEVFIKNGLGLLRTDTDKHLYNISLNSNVNDVTEIQIRY